MKEFTDAVIARASGTFGTFTVTDGNVKKANTQLLAFFGDKTVLIPLNARASFTVAVEHAAFDALLFALMGANIQVEYVDNLRTFLNADKRFDEFMKMDTDAATTFNTKFGLGLTAAELSIPALLASAKGKFATIFTAPQGSAPALDLDKLFPNQFDRESVEKWVTGTGDAYRITNGAQRLRDGSPETHNILRLKKSRTGNPTSVESLTGYDVTVNRFTQAFKVIRPFIEEGRESTRATTIRRGSYDDHRISVADGGKTVHIGCQRIPASEILRIAAELNIL